MGLFGRGMDIERVNIVFNYDMPEDSDTYLHRVARLVVSVLKVLQFHSLPMMKMKRFKTQSRIDSRSLLPRCPRRSTSLLTSRDDRYDRARRKLREKKNRC